jgi:hypothetical protein
MTMEKTKKTTKAAKCACPFCEEEVEVTALPFCQACGVAIRYCAKCETPAPKNAKVCPKCGGKLTSK